MGQTRGAAGSWGVKSDVSPPFPPSAIFAWHFVCITLWKCKGSCDTTFSVRNVLYYVGQAGSRLFSRKHFERNIGHF